MDAWTWFEVGIVLVIEIVHVPDICRHDVRCYWGGGVRVLNVVVNRHHCVRGLAQALKIPLLNQSLDVPMSNVELTVLGQGNGSVSWSTAVCKSFISGMTHPYSVWISPASFNTLTSMKRSFGGSKLPVRSISVH